MKITDEKQWEDFISVCGVSSNYFTTEDYIDWDFDLRVQKIGKHYRCFKRVSSGWKVNTSLDMEDEEVPINDQYQFWIDTICEEIGMEITALDVIYQESDDKYYILEVNSSAIGLNPKTIREDEQHIVELTIEKMELEINKTNNKPKKKKKSKKKVIIDIENS